METMTTISDSYLTDPVSLFKTRLTLYRTEPTSAAYIGFYWYYNGANGHYERECTGPISATGVNELLKADAEQTIRLDTIKHW